MDAEIVALVNTGTTTLVGLMVTDAWGKAKHAFARIIGRRTDDANHFVDELEAARSQLVEAPQALLPSVTTDVEAELRNRSLQAIRDDPAAVAQLRAFVAEYQPMLNHYSAPKNVTIKATANDSSKVYQQGYGTQYNA